MPVQVGLAGSAAPKMGADLETPCIGVCELDGRLGLCTGCGRTVAEIAAWSTMTPGDRREVMMMLPDRLRRLDSADKSNSRTASG